MIFFSFQFLILLIKKIIMCNNLASIFIYLWNLYCKRWDFPTLSILNKQHIFLYLSVNSVVAMTNYKKKTWWTVLYKVNSSIFCPRQQTWRVLLSQSLSPLPWRLLLWKTSLNWFFLLQVLCWRSVYSVQYCKVYCKNMFSVAFKLENLSLTLQKKTKH